MYRYIGNKSKLIPYILERTEELIGNNGVVADIMAGTGTVSLAYKKRGYSVTASDMMTYSYHHLCSNLLLSQSPKFSKLFDESLIIRQKETEYEDVIGYLNNLDGLEGFFFKEFSPDGKPQNGTNPRKYFTSKNAKKIDAIRATINMWIELHYINELEESLLKHTLIMAVNEVANISGTYGYFLSDFKKNSLSEIRLKSIQFYPEHSDNHIVKLGFAEDISATISADLCYIDPPYIKRQYAANYHILETIARGDTPDAIGKSGLRDWWDQHSKFCTKTRGLESFDKILSQMDCPIFLISYSEDGLFSLEQLEECFKKYGRVETRLIDYNRFRSNESKLPQKLKEYLISIERI